MVNKTVYASYNEIKPTASNSYNLPAGRQVNCGLALS